MLKAHELHASNPLESISNLSLEIASGEVVALIGNEGCGKRLLGQILSGSEGLQRGRLSINHYDVYKQAIRYKTQVGYLPNPVELEPFLTAFEYLDLIASFYRMPPATRAERIRQFIDELDFSDSAYSILDQVKSSTIQKVGLSASLIHQPGVVILDEPLQHLDWNGRIRAIKMINEAQKMGSAIILITDDLPLAENWAERFVIMETGEEIAQGTLKQLINQSRPADRSLVGVYEKFIGS